ncbi:MAG: hypothetical protein Q9174_003711 [Haloplaca sp. 1 TL-2023]
MQLQIYRDSLAHGATDRMVAEQLWEGFSDTVKLQLGPRRQSMMTWSEALLGIQYLIRVTLYKPEFGGFREQRWSVRRRTSPRQWVEIGQILLQPKPVGFTIPGSETPNVNTSKAAPAILRASFVVPDTKLTLLIPSRGRLIPQTQTVQALDGMIVAAYRDMTDAHRVVTLPELTGRAFFEGEVIGVRVRPHVNRDGSIFTTTDMVEMAVGLVYYMVEYDFCVFTAQIYRSDRRGKRSLVGSVELFTEQYDPPLSRLGNSTVIETA